MPRSLANALLVLTAMVWGSVFIAQEWAAEIIGPFSFNGVRFLIGAVLLLPLGYWEYRRHPLTFQDLGGSGILLLIGLGLSLGLGSAMQQAGIGMTTTANSGFLTTLYVPMVPIIALLVLRQSVRWIILPAVVLCCIGTYLLAGGANLLAGATDPTQALGDLITIGCAAIFAIHILLIQAFMRRHPTPFQASIIQAAIGSLLTLPVGLFAEGLTTDIVSATIQYTAYGAIMSVVIGFSLQLMAQAHTGPSTAAIILSLEAVFATFFAWLILNEQLGLAALVGCGMIFMGVVLVEAWPTKSDKREETT